MPANHKGNHKKADLIWDSGCETWERVSVTVLQVIRHELQQLNNLLYRSNFTDLPRVIRQIRTNTSKPKKRKQRKSD